MSRQAKSHEHLKPCRPVAGGATARPRPTGASGCEAPRRRGEPALLEASDVSIAVDGTTVVVDLSLTTRGRSVLLVGSCDALLGAISGAPIQAAFVLLALLAAVAASLALYAQAKPQSMRSPTRMARPG